MLIVPKSLRWWLTACLIGGLSCGTALAKDQQEPKKKGADKKSAEPKSLKEIQELKKELKNFDNYEEEDEEESSGKQYGTRIETPLIGQYATFSGINAIAVEGVGIVVGLKGTGGNPAPSHYRTALLEDLKRRGVRNPNEILKSSDTALVYLRASLPPLLAKGETVDVQVMIPESAEATSLHGGWLMEAYLSEQAFVPGKGSLSGHHFARVKGPVLTAAVGSNKRKSPALLTRGAVLGGGSVTKERELAIFLRNDFRSIRQAMRVSDAISKRFHDYDKHGMQQPMAVAKNDQKILLIVHPKYKNNFPRYLQVIRHLAFHEPTTARRLRIQRLKDELRQPELAEQAALQLEGIGKEAIPVLKAGLESPIMECRFHAASALAYLDQAAGVPVLAEAAKSEPAFRVYALAALSVIEDADANVALRKLMCESSMETRYGAFRSLWVLDKNDPFIRGEQIEVMEGKTGYMLHELETPGESLVHVTTRTRPEVVLYGKDQKLTAPLYLTAGKNIMVTAQAGAQTASVRKFTPDEPDQHREVPLTVPDVIRAVSELDGTYPDVVQMLMEAAEQNNLQGRFAHDALPEAGRMYERPPMPGVDGPKSKRKTRIGRDNLTPNLFPLDPEKEQPERDDADPASDLPPAMANVPEENSAKNAEVKTAKEEGPSRKEVKSEPKTEEIDEPAAAETRPSRFVRWPTALKPRVRRFQQTDEPAADEKPAARPTPKKTNTSQSEPAQTEPDVEDLATDQSEPQ